MSLNTLSALAILECKKYLRGKLSAVDFGNQRIRINMFHEKLKSNLDTSNFIVKPEYRKMPSARKFMNHIGFIDYDAIDLNNTDRSLIMDLNMDLCKRYGFRNTYSLVINNGTSEHIFNQSNIFKNMHNLCQINGILLNVLPLGPYLNHGFYNYNPVLFRDLAYANGYEWKFMWIGNSAGDYQEFDPNGEVNRETKRSRIFSNNFFNKWHNQELNSEIESFIYGKGRKLGHLNIVTAFSKISSEAFVLPIQGKWIHNIDKLISDSNILNYLKQPDTFRSFHS